MERIEKVFKVWAKVGVRIIWSPFIVSGLSALSVAVSAYVQICECCMVAVYILMVRHRVLVVFAVFTVSNCFSLVWVCSVVGWRARWLAEIWKSVGESQAWVHTAYQLLRSCWAHWQRVTVGGHAGMYIVHSRHAVLTLSKWNYCFAFLLSYCYTPVVVFWNKSCGSRGIK